MLASLNNCKVQLAAAENRELQLKKELNECKQKVNERGIKNNNSELM